MNGNYILKEGIPIIDNDFLKRTLEDIDRFMCKIFNLDLDKIDGVIIRQDRKQPVILFDYGRFLDLIKDVPE